MIGLGFAFYVMVAIALFFFLLMLMAYVMHVTGRDELTPMGISLLLMIMSVSGAYLWYASALVVLRVLASVFG